MHSADIHHFVSRISKLLGIYVFHTNRATQYASIAYVAAELLAKWRNLQLYVCTQCVLGSMPSTTQTVLQRWLNRNNVNTAKVSKNIVFLLIKIVRKVFVWNSQLFRRYRSVFVSLSCFSLVFFVCERWWHLQPIVPNAHYLRNSAYARIES